MELNPAISRLLEDFKDCRDLRLLTAAFDLASSDQEKRLVIGEAIQANEIDIQFREKLADSSVGLGDMLIAIQLCDQHPELLSIQVEAMIAIGQLVEAETLYLDLLAKNPVIESEEIASQIKNAKSELDGAQTSNVIGFSTASRGIKSQQRRHQDELNESSALYSEPNNALSFIDVGGLEDVKKQITRKIVTPFKKPSLFAKYRRKAGGGVLLFGPPGCGKTLLARATAGECDARFYNISIVDVIDKYIGEAERKLSAIFEQARSEPPAVLFFDELEALAGSRSTQQNHSYTSLVSTFLTEMDGFAQNNDGVLVLAATNMPWGVDAAFRRPGRFDRVQFVPPPDRTARGYILKLMLEGRPVSSNLDIAKISNSISGFSGADIENLVNTAVDLAIEESISSGSEQEVDLRHLMEAKQEVRPTTIEWLTTARNYTKYSNVSGQYDDVADFLKENGL